MRKPSRNDLTPWRTELMRKCKRCSSGVPTPRAHYCTLKCRILFNVEQTQGGCWLWKGALNHNGYATMKLDGYARRAHRFIYENLTGETIPEGMQLDHTCKNRHCVNPDHLDVVTQYENMRRGECFTHTDLMHEVWRQRTHCKNGHSFAAHSYVNANGHRICRACKRAYVRKT